ncbi:MAG TPA: hypothetical protein VNL98_07300 [Gemmatimonadales bacterium]|nr:hypothetical protein [Gemmatimonadales bacterium]
MKVRYNQSGYCGSSRSVRAAQAESLGRYPLTRAVGELAGLARITRRAARSLLEALGPAEWHHTSKHANRTDYYDAAHAAWLLDEATDEELDDETDHVIAFVRAIRARRDAERAAYERALRAAEKARAKREAAERAEAEARRAEAARLVAEREAARQRAAQERDRQIAALIERYRRSPTEGRAQALRQYGLDPAAVLAGG